MNDIPSCESLIEQLRNIRKLYQEASPVDDKLAYDYARIIVLLLRNYVTELGSVNARQMLADYLQLPSKRPSRLHSYALSAAVKVFDAYPEFRFATFLKMWDLESFLVGDNIRHSAPDGKKLPSLVDRVMKRYGMALLIHPEDGFVEASAMMKSRGYSVLPMIVSRFKEAVGKDGRKYRFVTLTSNNGVEVETIANSLLPSPAIPLPEGKRHYVNVGQLYNVLLRRKSDTDDTLSFVAGYVSGYSANELFPTEIGFVEAIDESHGHIHVFDSYSRHFVAHVLRFSRERVGDFVRFIPVVPQTSKFKTAVILGTVPASSEDVRAISREICITSVNTEKGYAAWQLVDSSSPITELLSPLQLSQGEQSPSFTTGYINLSSLSQSSSSSSSSHSSPSHSLTSLAVDEKLHAIIYLRRGKDGQKRPRVALLF